MSRVGFKPIPVPSGVTVSYDAATQTATAKGPKGELTQHIPAVCEFKEEDGNINVGRPTESKQDRAFHGLTRALLNNMIIGVSEGFTRELEINGVGWRAEVQGKQLVMTLGFSHPINFPFPEGITIETPEQTKIKVTGIDKQKVGQTAALIREFRPPEPYKGKGVKYVEEHIQRKAGKTAAGGG